MIIMGILCFTWFEKGEGGKKEANLISAIRDVWSRCGEIRQKMKAADCAGSPILAQ